MAKKIQIDIEVNGKMQRATVSTKKLKDALDSAKTSQDNLNASTRTGYRAMQGTAANSANATKNFAKQSGIVGGLVPIYATLAANVFAVSAAFGTFRRAAQVERLEASLIRTGNIGGQNLQRVADGLVEITGNAIDAEMALRTVAQGTTQGFSTAQLQGLTTIAKGASIALGRELPDALDRLVRGTAKLEPEILDELGIIVRLDDAASAYGSTIGKTANELTAYEKQQAFANAVLEQGLNKFESVAKAVDPNPYDQLAASFSNLAKVVLEGVNVALTPLITLLAEKPTALIGVLGIFASGIVKQLTPAIGEMAENSKEKFSVLSRNAKQAAATIETKFTKALKNLSRAPVATPKGFRDVEKAIRAGTASTAQYKKALKSLSGALGGQRAALKKLEAAEKGLRGAQRTAHKMLIAEKKGEIDLIEQQINATKRLQQTQMGQGGLVQAPAKARSKAKNAAAASRIGRREATALGMMAGAGPVQQFKIAAKATGNMTKEITKSAGAFGKVATGARIAAVGVRLFGTALLNAIPVVGQLIFAGTLLYEGFKKIFGDPFEKNEMEKGLDAALEKAKELNKGADDLADAMARAANETERAFLAAANRAGTAQEGGGIFTALAATATAERTTQIKQANDTLDFVTGKSKTSFAIFRLFSKEYREAQRSLAEQRAEYMKKGEDIPPELKHSVGNIKKEMARLAEVGVEAAKEFEREFEKSEVRTVVQSALDQAINAGMGEETGYVKTLQDALEQVSGDGKISADAVHAIGEAIAESEENTTKFLKSFEGLGQAVGNVRTELDKLVKKEDTPFTAMLEQAQQVDNLLARISETQADAGVDVSTKELFNEAVGGQGGSEQALKFIDEVVRGTDAYAKALEETKNEADALAAAQAVVTQSFDTADQLTRSMNNTLKDNLREQKDISNFVGISTTMQAELERLEKSALQTKIEQKQAIVNALRPLEQHAGVLEYIEQLEAEIATHGKEKTDIDEDQVRKAKSLLGERQNLAKIQQELIDGARRELQLLKDQERQSMKSLQIDQERSKLARSGDAFGYLFEEDNRLKDQIAAVQQEIALKKANQKEEDKLKKAQIAQEYMLLEAKYTYLSATQAALADELQAAAPLGKDDPVVKKLRAQITQLDKLKEAFSVGDLAFDSEGNLEGLETVGERLKAVFNNVGISAGQDLDLLDLKLQNLQNEFAKLQDPIARAAEAGRKALTEGLSDTLGEIIQGTKSAKDAFADLATSILKSMADIYMDDFVKDLMGRGQEAFGGSGGIMGAIFGKNKNLPNDGSTPTKTGDSITTPDAVNQAITGSNPPMTGMGGGLDGKGLGTTIPLLVRIAEGVPAGPTAPEGSGVSSVAGSAAEDQKTATEEQTDAVTKNTEATLTGNLQTASMVTAGLATVAALTGNEGAAKKLAIVTALLQTAVLANTIATQMSTATEGGGSFLSLFGFRKGGIASPNMYSKGGIAKGAEGGYPAMLHGTEAVVPLPNGKSIPVEMSGAGGGSQQNNVSVNVVMNSDGSSSTSTEKDGREAAELGKSISLAVQEELKKQKRSGGLLSPYGVA